MTDDEIDEFMILFREYRENDSLPPEKRERFRELSAKWREMNKRMED
jgi:hypothetical protein